MFQLNHVNLNGSARPRLDHVTVMIPSGRTAIVGCSGAGKTSLLNVLAEFEPVDAGTVWRMTRGEDRGEGPEQKCSGAGGGASWQRRLPLYWVPQNGGLWPHLTVVQHLTCVGSAESSDKLLQSLDLEQRRSALPAELSLGERSRLALARALATPAEVLLLDEPLSHVDPVKKPGYWNVIREWVGETSANMVEVAPVNGSSTQRETSIVFTSHEPETVLRHAQNVICLHDGRVVYQGTTTALYDRPPSREVGEFLGALNWFDAAEAVVFLHGQPSASNAFAIRPERLSMRPDADSEIEFLLMPFRGGYAESVVRHVISGHTRTVLHQVTGDIPLTGQRVRLVAGGCQ